MASKNASETKMTGVIGAGSFGTAISNLLAANGQVLLYARKAEVKQAILDTRNNAGQTVHNNVTPTTDIREITNRCRLIFPTVPSANFRGMMREFADFFQPHHILIHATKGLDAQPPLTSGEAKATTYTREHIKTMSEVILEESVVLRVGALAGPNLAMELAGGKPAATVIASKFDEVIKAGRIAMRSPNFQVYGNHDIIGVELSGILKNAIAIASGGVSGLGLGENARALLITKGLSEMIRLGSALGSDTTAFFGLAGVGDLVATCNSELSRNFTVGHRLARGESLEEIIETSSEVAEGINTIRIARQLGEFYKVKLPIINMLYEILYEDVPPREGLARLMEFPYAKDVDFL